MIAPMIELRGISKRFVKRLDLAETVVRAVGPREQQVARLLDYEMQRLHGVKLTVTSGPSSKPGPSITLAETSSPRCAGRQCMNSAFGFAKAITRSST